MDLALNNLQSLIYHKNPTNQTTNQQNVMECMFFVETLVGRGVSKSFSSPYLVVFTVFISLRLYLLVMISFQFCGLLTITLSFSTVHWDWDLSRKHGWDWQNLGNRLSMGSLTFSTIPSSYVSSSMKLPHKQFIIKESSNVSQTLPRVFLSNMWPWAPQFLIQ